jgi:predicted permease
MSSIWMDLRFGLRGMLRSSGLTAVAVLSLALGIGANTAIFSFVNALILKMLPVENPKALVWFGPGDAEGNSGGFPDGDMNLFSYLMYRDIAGRNQVFSGVAAVCSWQIGLNGRVEPSGHLEPMKAQLVSGTYFNVLGVDPILGRTLTDADDQVLGGHPVAVISYGWWTTRFARDPGVVGKALKIGDTLYTIVGVAPRGFFGATVGDSPDMWIPLEMMDAISRGPHKLNDKFYEALDIFARLKPGVSVAEANAGVNTTLKALLHEYAGTQPSREHLTDIQKAHIGLRPAATGKSLLRYEFADPLWTLMAIVGIVLLVACANIANLLLARGSMRQREIAVRMALGAGRGRLLRQLLTESLLLAAVGGAMGVVFASWVNRFLLEMASGGPEIVPLDVALDGRVLGFTIFLSLLTAILFGVAPALRAGRIAPTAALTAGRSGAPGQRRSLLGKAIIVAQVSLSLVLLIGAGLFIRSIINLVNVNAGFNRQNVLLLNLDVHATGYTDEPRLAGLYRQITERVNAVPGVEASSFSIFTFNHGAWNESAWPEHPTAATKEGVNGSYNAVGPGYFAALGLPILEGRGIGEQDTATSPKVAVINETMARKLFPRGPAVGKRFGMGDSTDPKDIEVIGVVRDAKYLSLSERPQALAYYPYTQYRPEWGIGLYLSHFNVRCSGDPKFVASAIRQTIAEINTNLPIVTVETLAERVADSVVYPRLVAELSGFFGILAVLLACIGIYGLMSFAVNRRTNEIGIRMALGAAQTDVVRMVMREVVALVAIGLAIGVPAALASDRWAASLLFGLKPSDPLTLAGATVLLLSVAVLAGYLPARRAAKVDPMVALRYE